LAGLSFAQSHRAAAWVGLGNAEKAVYCYNIRSLAIEVEDPAVLVNRAIATEQSGDITGAREDRRRAAGISE
jgi:hypothetical protein